jgi:hypothetical protein
MRLMLEPPSIQMPRVLAARASPGEVHTDVVAVDPVVPARLQADAAGGAADGKAIDHQPAHGAVPSGNVQPNHIAARQRAVEFDQRRAGVARAALAPAVDGHGVGDGGQRGCGLDGLLAARRADGEGDGVRPGAGVGVQDRLAQRARAAVRGSGHGEGGGDGCAIGCQRQPANAKHQHGQAAQDSVAWAPGGANVTHSVLRLLGSGKDRSVADRTRFREMAQICSRRGIELTPRRQEVPLRLGVLA